MSRYCQYPVRRYYYRCGDCGQDIGEQKVSKRWSICDGCWENRGWVLDNVPKFGLATFKRIQKKMVGRRGSAKAYIESLKAVWGNEVESDIELNGNT